MGHTPTEASDILRFTPSPLANLPTPPVFLLKAGTRRDRDRFQKRLRIEGFSFHTEDEIRAETEAGLRANWDEETFAAHIGRVRQYWDAVDAHRAQVGEVEDSAPLEYDPVEVAAITNLLARTTEHWPPLRKLEADFIEYHAGSPSVMLSLILVGWEGFDVSFAKEDGIVSLDKLEEVETELVAIEKAARANKIEGIGQNGTSYLALCAEAGARLFLSKVAEKNSSSPAQSQAIQQPMKEIGQASKSGTSKVPAPSEPTLEA